MEAAAFGTFVEEFIVNNEPHIEFARPGISLKRFFKPQFKRGKLFVIYIPASDDDAVNVAASFIKSLVG